MVSKAWQTMNSLDEVTTKICSAREIIDVAVEAIQHNDYSRAETLASAAYEFLGYYLDEFDKKFQDAWKETVVKQKEQEEDPCMPPWGHSDMEYLIKNKKDKVKKWVLPVQQACAIDNDGEYFVNFPDDLLAAANLKEGDQIEWVDNNDGTFLLVKQ